MEVDLSKPLVSKFKLRRRIRRLQYEGIHLVCFGCGMMYGHRKETCPLEKPRPTAAPENNEGNSPNGASTTEQIRIEERGINPEIVEDFGSWMLVPRRSRIFQRKQV